MSIVDIKPQQNMPLQLPCTTEQPIPLPPQEELGSAEWTYERMVGLIMEFEGQLDKEHEVGAYLTSFGSDAAFHIEDMGFWEPDIITFRGTKMNGERVKLIQHISQLNVLLIAVRKPKEQPEPRRIGFDLSKKIPKKKAG